MKPTHGLKPHERICVALDLPTLDEAEALAQALAGQVGVHKVGLELFSAAGPDAVRRIAAHGPVFLDLKLHDIPTTVERAARQLGRLGIAYLTVHASGGTAMVAAAVAGATEGAGQAGVAPPVVLGVTVLTSMTDADLRAVNQPTSASQVPDLAALAVDAGAGGLICAPTDVTLVRDRVGPDPQILTPGVRPATADQGDQARVATPAAALAAGADRLVIGRPITRADDPVAAARAIAQELGATAS